MICWRRNLLLVGGSQFLSMMAFTFAFPFIPFYMQELGVTDPIKLKLCISAFAAAAPISLAIFAPIWGAVGDRYGRKLMLLRANWGAVFFLTLMGLADSVVMLIVVRTIQGVLTGTMTAAQTLVAAHTPRERSGLALGTLSAGVFSGSMAGSMLGGVFADAFGYRHAFFASAVIMVFAAVLSSIAREDFTPPPAATRLFVSPAVGYAKLRPLLGILLLGGAVAGAQQFAGPFLPLLVQEINGGIEGASRLTGGLFAVASVAGFLSGITMGHLADRMDIGRLGLMAAVVAAIFMAPQAFVHTMPPLYVLRFGVAFAAGGLAPTLQACLSKHANAADRGFIFGWAGTLRALGWGVTPIISGSVASLWGVRAVFPVGGALFLLLAAALPLVLRQKFKA
jgi:MFS transporter, DHA1 family, multidrug resistance protein